MNKKDMLKQKARPKLATSTVTSPEATDASTALVEKDHALKNLTLEVKSDFEELQGIYDWWRDKKERVAELRHNIIQKLIYVRDDRKSLLPDRTFEDYLTNDIGISKGYFYDQIRVYELVKEHNVPELFNNVDYKLLAEVSRFKDEAIQKALLDKSDELTREDLKYFKENESDISVEDVRKYAGRTFHDVIDVTPISDEGRRSPADIAIDLIKEYTQRKLDTNNKDESLFLSSKIESIHDFSKALLKAGWVLQDEYNKIKKVAEESQGSFSS